MGSEGLDSSRAEAKGLQGEKQLQMAAWLGAPQGTEPSKASPREAVPPGTPEGFSPWNSRSHSSLEARCSSCAVRVDRLIEAEENHWAGTQGIPNLQLPECPLQT